jgi:hypothetical protein
MEIKYDKKGRILSCSRLKGIERGKQIIELADNDLPEDFFARFAFGKYIVKKGKIVENPEFIPPEPAKSSLLTSLEKLDVKIKSNKSKKRKKKTKRRNSSSNK